MLAYTLQRSTGTTMHNIVIAIEMAISYFMASVFLPRIVYMLFQFKAKHEDKRSVHRMTHELDL